MSNTENQRNLEQLIEEGDEIFADYSRRMESRPIYEKALKMAKEGGKLLEIEYVQGKIDLVDEKYEDAVKHFDEVIKMNSNYFKAWNYKGIAFGNLGRYEEALTCYDKAIKIKPDYEKAWYNKGVALYNLGRYEEALTCYDKAIKIKPDYGIAWYNKGVALGNLGRYEEALTCYDKAIKIKPDFEYVWNNKGIALGNLGRYEEALTCYDKAIKIKPDFEYAWYNKGVALYNLGRYEEALACYDKAIKIKPDFELPRANRNLILIHLGKFDEAEKEREKIYSDKKEEISKSKLPPEEKKSEILEIDAWKEVLDELKDKITDILDAKKDYEKNLAASLNSRNNPLNLNFFSVLRRWNSYTPTLHTATEENLGGGYFLFWKGKGIVIDPGFNFVDNFLNNGFLIYDIDAVIITHAHVDHCSDFESLLTLLFEYNENKANKKRIDIFMNIGAMKKILGWINLEESGLVERVFSLEEGISRDLKKYNLRLTVTRALHDEVLSKAYSTGLIFELYGEDGYTRENPFRIGYTSDTRHDEDVENQYKGVDIIVSHLGSIDENDFTFKEERRNKNHLMLKGTISTIYKSNAKLAIVSEFGEELGEHRMVIIGALNKVFRKNDMARCLTGDIGLNVLIPGIKVKCRYCEKYVDIHEILEGIDPTHKAKKRIIHYCKDCKNTYEFQVKDSEKSG